MNQINIKKLEGSRLIEVSVAIFLSCLVAPTTLILGLPKVWAASVLFGTGVLLLRYIYDRNLVYFVRYGKYLVNPRYLLAGAVGFFGFGLMSLIIAIGQTV